MRASVVVSLASTTAVTLPPMLTGALAVQIRQSLNTSPASLGLSLATFFGATAMLSVLLSGRLGARVEPRIGLGYSLGVTSIALLILATSTSVAMFVAGMVVGGIANAMLHPLVTAYLLQDDGLGGLGLALGLKQAAPPIAGVLGGLAVPVVALTVGWRAAFLLAGGIVLLAAGALLGRRQRLGTRVGAVPVPVSRLKSVVPQRVRMIALAAGAGTAAGMAVPSFIVDSSVAVAGLSESHAGLLAATAGVCGIVVRVLLANLADRLGPERVLTAVIVLVMCGGAGMWMMSMPQRNIFIAGGLLAYALGWGWMGGILFSTVAMHRSDGALVTGAIMAGFASGSALGPLVLGVVADVAGYSIMWRLAGSFALVSATGLLGVRYRASRGRLRLG